MGVDVTILFICNFFNDTVSHSHYIVLNDSITVSNKFGKLRKDMVLENFGKFTGILLNELRRPTKELKQGGRPSRD
jgi:hypothetical protein